MIVIFIAFATSTAMALEPPPRPARASPRPADCVKKVAAPSGSIAPCDGVLVPPAALADLYADRSWALLLKERYILDTIKLEAEVGRRDWEKEYLTSVIEDLNAPIPFFDRPGVRIAAGALLGAGTTVGIAYSLKTAYN